MSKILIIEDETIISFGYRLQLERMGFEVIGTARSSAEAEDLLRNERPDLIIMDIYLKGEKNGLELAQEIHATDPIPIIFLTAAFKSEEFQQRGYAIGAVDYLLKPIEDNQFINKISTYFRLIEKERALNQVLERQVAERTAELAQAKQYLDALGP